MAELPPWFIVAVAVALGLAFGSFLNVVIYRLPRGLNVAHPGSRCPACDTPIRGYDNIPVVSWLVLRGRARCCKAPIAVRYPLIETMGGLLAWAIVQMKVLPLPPDTEFWRWGTLFALYLAVGLGLIAAAFIDLEHLYLPDEITLGGAVLGLVSVLFREDLDWQQALLGAALGFVMVWLPFDLLYSRLRGAPGMGLGDAKLVMLAGAWFGWKGALFALLAGAVQGTLGATAVYLATGVIEEPDAVKAERQAMQEALANAEGKERAELERELARDPIAQEPEPGLAKARLAFGPFLVLACLEYLLFGDIIVEGYLNWVWQA